MKPFPLYLCVLWLCSVEQSEAAFGCVTRGARKGTPRGALQPSNIITKQFQILPRKFATLKTTTARATSSDEDHDADENDVTIVTPGSEDEGVSDQMWDYIETGEPPKSVIMKQLLGINVFTYVLAAAIAFFLAANSFLGPGWLGQSFGWKGAGTYTQTSDSLPDMVNLNNPDNLF